MKKIILPILLVSSLATPILATDENPSFTQRFKSLFVSQQQDHKPDDNDAMSPKTAAFLMTSFAILCSLVSSTR